MAHARTPQAIQDAIGEGPAGETPRQIIARIQAAFGVEISATTAKKYRRRAREERAAATKELREEHAREHTTGALADLTELRERARKIFRATYSAAMGKLWLDSIKCELAVVGADEKVGEFDQLTDAELEAIACGSALPAPGPKDKGPSPAGA